MRKFFLFSSLLMLMLLAGVYLAYRSWIFDTSASLEAGSKIAKTSLGSIEYLLLGNSGPVLLSVHGTPGGYNAFGWMRKSVTESGMRWLRVSRPGYLRTPLEVGRTPAEQADAYVALLDVLGIDRVAVMGVSGGSPSSLELAARHPERVWALVHLMGVSASMPKIKEQKADARVIQKIIESDFGGWLISLSLPDSAPALLGEMIPNPENRRRLVDDADNLATFVKSVKEAGVLMSKRADGKANDLDQFSELSLTPFNQITAPTLVLHGSADTDVDIAMGRSVAEGIAGAELMVIDEADHWMPVTHSDEIMSAILKFLNREAPNKNEGDTL
jgi:pimeloyl-ACP methyl ester carboxylesterase